MRKLEEIERELIEKFLYELDSLPYAKVDDFMDEAINDLYKKYEKMLKDG